MIFSSALPLKSEQSIITTHGKISKFVKFISQKIFDLQKKLFTRDYTSTQRTNIPSFIEICDGGCHGLCELTWNDAYKNVQNSWNAM